MKTLSLIATTALLLAGIGMAGAAAPNEKSATAKATKEAKKAAKKPAAKAPAGTVKQKTTEDNLGEPK